VQELNGVFLLRSMFQKIISEFRLKNLSRIMGIARLRPFDTSLPEGRSRERHRKILLSTSSNFLARGLSLAVNLLVIRLVLSRLGKEEYGVWVAITAFLMWSTLLDFGILNSLVNAVSEAYGKNDRETINRHVSTGFFSLIIVAVALAIVTVIFLGQVHWSILFASSGVVNEHRLRWSVAAAIVPFIAGIPLSVMRQTYMGLQKTYVSNVFLVLSSLLTVGAVMAAIAYGASLPWLVLASGIGAPLAALFNFGYLVKWDMPWLKPRLDRFSMDSLRRLLKSSTPLFLFQFGALLVNYSQPFLLAHVTSYSLVADYSLLLRLYSLAGTVFVLSTSSFFPAFREAFEKGDHNWVRRNFFRMLGLRMVLSCTLGLVLVLAGNAVLKVWLGKDVVSFSTPIWSTLAFILAVSAWGTAFSDLLTVMDRIWIQVAVVLLNGAATVLLTVWLAPRIGVLGALAATGFVPVLVWSWAGPFISRSILNFKVKMPSVT
jgi:O-antigen/teichoic acid export membrane protein